jgi:hypothetical protein
VKSRRTLIAGPWVGEFGWELFAWQGYVRALSRHFEKTVVICRPNSKAIYEDFADEFVFSDKRTGLSDSYYMHNFEFVDEIQNLVSAGNLTLNTNTSLCIPRRIGTPPHTHYLESFIFGDIEVKPEYIVFGSKIETEYDFIFHARNRELRKEDNWSPENWKRLLELLGAKVACIGSKNEAYHIPGTTDLRGTDSQTVFNLLRSCKAVFGPSSGPMHLSSLCTAKHVVWGLQSLSCYRYEKNWNPHHTPVLFLEAFGWHPSPEYVHQSYMNWKDK